MRPIILSDRFFWNLHQSVGKNASNSNPTDVGFVQWSFVQATTHPGGMDPADLHVYGAVRVTGACSGRDDDPLVAAILALQRNARRRKPAMLVDGHVSVAHDSITYAPHAAFLILDLCTAFAGWYPNAYPRLDLMPGCPADVAAAVRNTIPG